MRKENREFIDSYLNVFTYSGIDSLFELFKSYSTLDVFSLQDLKRSVNEFCDYIKDNASKIKTKDGYSEDVVIRALESFKRSIMVSIDRYLSDDYKNFANMVFELSPSKRKERVLDVGAGRIPSSSIWLAQNMKEVATIDNEFYLSGVSLKNMNVSAIESYFNCSTDVSNYSFVVGRCPCLAIRQMVKKCSEANIPYLIKLCDCDVRVANKYVNNDNAWRVVLPDYDKNVKFYKDFAYNLDVNEKQLASIIEKYDSKPPLRARRVKVIRYYENGNLINEEEVEL